MSELGRIEWMAGSRTRWKNDGKLERTFLDHFFSENHGFLFRRCVPKGRSERHAMKTGESNESNQQDVANQSGFKSVTNLTTFIPETISPVKGLRFSSV